MQLTLHERNKIIGECIDYFKSRCNQPLDTDQRILLAGAYDGCLYYASYINESLLDRANPILAVFPSYVRGFKLGEDIAKRALNNGAFDPSSL